MEQVTLDISENVCRAMDYAFEEAQQYLTSGAGLIPFTVTLVDGGLEINDHEAQTSEEVYESVRNLLAQDMPEGYAFCYDGYVETDLGEADAIIVEAADRGAATAEALALIYTQDEDGGYVFEASYGFAGKAPQLYPAGTKPIVSGMSALDEDDLAAMEREREISEDEAAGDEGSNNE